MADMEQGPHPVKPESRQYATPRWWHKPFWFGVATLGVLVLTLWLFMRANLLPIDLVGISLFAAASIVVGSVLFSVNRAEEWLQNLNALARGAFIAGVLLASAFGIVMLYKMSDLWLPHFLILR